MVLTGVCRFDLADEMSTTRGYRMIVPDWSRFSEDCADSSDSLEGRHPQLIETLRGYFEVKGFETDMEMVERLSVMRLVDSLTMALPFDIGEKRCCSKLSMSKAVATISLT